MPSLFNLYHFSRPQEARSGALRRPWEFWAARLPQAIRAGAAALGSLRRRSAHAAPGAGAEPARPRPPGRQLMGRPPGRPPPPREHGGRDPLQAAEQPSGAAEQDRGAPGRRHGRAAHPQGGRRHHRQRRQVGPAGGAPAETRSGRPVLRRRRGVGAVGSEVSLSAWGRPRPPGWRRAAPVRDLHPLAPDPGPTALLPTAPRSYGVLPAQDPSPGAPLQSGTPTEPPSPGHPPPCSPDPGPAPPARDPRPLEPLQSVTPPTSPVCLGILTLSSLATPSHRAPSSAGLPFLLSFVGFCLLLESVATSMGWGWGVLGPRRSVPSLGARSTGGSARDSLLSAELRGFHSLTSLLWG